MIDLDDLKSVRMASAEKRGLEVLELAAMVQVVAVRAMRVEMTISEVTDLVRDTWTLLAKLKDKAIKEALKP